MPKLIVGLAGIALLAALSACAHPVLGRHQALFSAKNATVSTVVGTSLSQPFALALDTKGNLFVSDYSANSVWKLQPQQGTWEEVNTGIPLSGAGGVAVAPNGTLYLSSVNSNEIVEVSTDGSSNVIANVTQLVDQPYGMKVVGDVLYFSNHNSGQVGSLDLTKDLVTFLPATVVHPTGLVMSPDGDLYVTTFDDFTVVKFRPTDPVASPYVGISGAPGAANGTTVGAMLNWPQGVALDQSGNLYVADSNNNMIRKVTPAGLVSTVAGLGNSSPGSKDGSAAVATLNLPTDVVVDADGNLYVADSGNGAIRKITFE